MKAKIGSVIVAGIGAVMMMKGMGEQTVWSDLPGMFGPLATFGLLLVLWRAWSGQGQMKAPDIKKLGKKL